MSSQRRINASRANGAKSKGPITPEGKARSAMNSLRHGLLAKTLLITGENPAALDAVTQMHVSHFQPADGVEFGIVEELVAYQWRLNRCWVIETANFNQQIAACPSNPSGDTLEKIRAAYVNMAEMPHCVNISRYESRLQLQYQRALRNLAMIRNMPPNKPIPIYEPNEEMLASLPKLPQPADSEATTQKPAAPADSQPATAANPSSTAAKPKTTPQNPAPEPQHPSTPYSSPEIEPLWPENGPKDPLEDAA